VLARDTAVTRGVSELGLAPSYRLGRRLDDGGLNEVYVATYPGASGPVVMKFLRRALHVDLLAGRLSQREAARVARIRHPHLASTLALGATPEGVPYLVREYLGGETLDAHLARRILVAPYEALALVKSIAAALAAVHEAAVVHGDLRPSKVFLGGPGAGSVKLVDAGLWRLGGDPCGPGALADKARFTAPERIEGTEEVDGRADQFALAAIAYRLFAGVDAYPGDDVAAVLRSVVEETPPPILPEVHGDAAIDAVIRRGLARAPRDRFDTVGAFVAALEEAFTQEVAEPTTVVRAVQVLSVTSLPRRRRARGKRLLLLVALAAAATWSNGWPLPSIADVADLWAQLR
jgi:serine/threonine protein kinase